MELSRDKNSSFSLSAYIKEKEEEKKVSENQIEEKKKVISKDKVETLGFKNVLKTVENYFEEDFRDTDDFSKALKIEREKKAIMGFPQEMNLYKERIKEILAERKLEKVDYPSWYPNLTEAVFAELYGLSGLAPWAYDMEPKYRESSSAKLIGDRLYCLIDGKSELQPQRIPKARREKLKRALLLATPSERLEYGFHEVYLRNGIRITIYSGHRTKDNQDIMVFRKYILREYSFETLAEKGTIPYEAIILFETMVKIGFNVIFSGQVRSGKTTFLQVWQTYEDKTMEGLSVATDPETPWHIIMPEAPIMQIVADGKDLEVLNKSLLRGDNDYILLEEMRDGTAFQMALDITSTGTKRSKATIHESDPTNIPYRMASKIREKYGGNQKELETQVLKNFDYVIELCQDPKDRSRKIMKSIAEYSFNVETGKGEINYICKREKDKWLWSNHISENKYRRFADEEKNLLYMSQILRKLSLGRKAENWRIIPSYSCREE